MKIAGSLAVPLLLLLLAFGASPASAAYTSSRDSSTLTLQGDAASDVLALRLKQGDTNTLELDLDNDGDADQSVDRSGVTALVVNAGDGDDAVLVSDTPSPLHTLMSVTLKGEGGADRLEGGGGATRLEGGEGADFIDGGPGNDFALAGPGDDRFRWDPGDGSDQFEGQGDHDELVFNGSANAENIAINPTAEARIELTRDIGLIEMDLSGIEGIEVNAGVGTDTVDGLQVDLPLRIDGGADGDTLKGGGGADALVGGNGVDTITGAGSADRIDGGAANDNVNGDGGDDTFVWEALDGSDGARGGEGADTVEFHGSAASESVLLEPAGRLVGDVKITRLAGATTEAIDINSFARLDLSAGSGSDTVLAEPFALSDFTHTDIDVGAPSASGADDDTVIVRGATADRVSAGRGENEVVTGDGDDTMIVAPNDAGSRFEGGGGSDRVVANGSDAGDAHGLQVQGDGAHSLTRAGLNPHTLVTIDALELDLGAGADAFAPDPAVALPLVVRGGSGGDDLAGAAAADRLLGDADADTLTGRGGADEFRCGEAPDAITDLASEDVLGSDCVAKPAPPAQDPVPPVQQPSAPAAPGGGAGAALPAGFRGFGRPRVRASLKALRVTVKNTHSDAIRLRVGATERKRRFRAITKLVPAGASGTFVLKTPAKLVPKLRRELARRGQLVRRPRLALTNVATGGRSVVAVKTVLKRR